MHASRRSFLTASAALLAAPGWAAQRSSGQGQGQGQRLPDANPPFSAAPMPPPTRSEARLLKSNQEAIKKDIARMSELLAQVQDALNTNASTDVLSLDVLHKTEEIEKLAKQIRSLLKG